jgi:hypothetical protein
MDTTATRPADNGGRLRILSFIDDPCVMEKIPRHLHKISSDDPIGLEKYWHRRFKAKRKNGEWFVLNKEDIAEFCNHSRMDRKRYSINYSRLDNHPYCKTAKPFEQIPALLRLVPFAAENGFDLRLLLAYDISYE